MMQPSNSGKTKGKSTKGRFPPNPKQWNVERNGLELRSRLHSDLADALDHEAAFRTLAHVSINPHGSIPAADVFLDHFRGAGASSWSGLAMTLEDGHELVFYNDAHPLSRIRATLMEEYFHLWLGHPRSSIRILDSNGPTRSYDASIEDEAFQSGAAALVPYWALKKLVDGGRNAGLIAQQFRVSRDLVIFRSKVTKCYRSLNRN